MPISDRQGLLGDAQVHGRHRPYRGRVQDLLGVSRFSYPPQRGYELIDGVRGTLRTSQSPADIARAATIKNAFLKSALFKKPRSFEKQEGWVTSVLDKSHWSATKVRAAVSVVYHKPKMYVSRGSFKPFLG